MQRGRDEKLVEVLVAVACAHVARNGDGTVIIDIGIATYRLVGTVLGHGIVYPHTVFIATGEYSAYACAYPDVEPLCLTCRPELHEIELCAKFHAVGIHHIVAIGLYRHHLGIDSREALLTAIARPDVVGTNANPRANGEVDAATYCGRQLIALLGVEVLIPHTVSPRQSSLSVNAPSISAQFLISIAWRISYALTLGLRLSAYREERCKQYAEPYSCPSAI